MCEGKNHGFGLRFPLQPLHWHLETHGDAWGLQTHFGEPGHRKGLNAKGLIQKSSVTIIQSKGSWKICYDVLKIWCPPKKIETEINTPKQQNPSTNRERATRSFLRILSQKYLAWSVWPVRKGIYILHKKVGSLSPILSTPPLPWLYKVNTRGIYRMLAGQTNGCMTTIKAQMGSRLEMWELNSSNSPWLAISSTSALCMNYRCLKSKRMY